MPYGLCNGPASLQHCINDIMFKFLYRFCTAYLEDILIYCETLTEHRSHVCQVLEKLLEAGHQFDTTKPQFYVQEVAFLSTIVTTQCPKMDPKMVTTIND